MLIRRSFLALLFGVFVTAPVAWARAETSFITVASTTSTEASGLFPHLLPAFTKASGIEVHVVAVGTGQALTIGRNGDADVLFVHDRKAELKFIKAGYGIDRHDVMYNDFIVVGPKSDPAGIDGSKDIVAAFTKIATAHAPFISRGDDSGTNRAELRFWHDAGTDPKKAGKEADWYKDIGGGMGAALNTAAALDAYTLSDRGTWLHFGNKRDLTIAVEGDKLLFNQYGVMLVNPAKHPSVKTEAGRKFINWLISPEGQRTIADYKINNEQLFFPDANKPNL